MIMRYYYGEQNVLRALDEAEFWKHQEAEHTTVIQLVTPDLEHAYVSKLDRFGNEFNQKYAEVIRYIESATRSKNMIDRRLKMQMVELVRQCVEQSKEFVVLLEDMLQNSAAVRASNPSQTVINHIIRESNYFIGIDTLILNY